jgi:hypothetical protein
MRIIIGGESSNVGKTTVICRLIRGFPDIAWTVVKISGHGHGLEPGAWALAAESEPGPAKDTQRYLAAGAAHALWLRGDLEAALPALRQRLALAPDWIIESTRAGALIEHDVSILVRSGNGEEIKESAKEFRPGISVTSDDPHLIERVAGCWQPDRG